jgi:hypothetical protein
MCNEYFLLKKRSVEYYLYASITHVFLKKTKEKSSVPSDMFDSSTNFVISQSYTSTHYPYHTEQRKWDIQFIHFSPNHSPFFFEINLQFNSDVPKLWLI